MLRAALFFRLKAKAFKTCKESADAYAQCCQGRSVSMVWACRAELKAMSACLGEQCVPTPYSNLPDGTQTVLHNVKLTAARIFLLHQMGVAPY